MNGSRPQSMSRMTKLFCTMWSIMKINRDIPKAQHRSQTRSHVDERPHLHIPGSMDPDAYRSKQAKTVYQSSRKQTFHKMRDGGLEKKTPTCELRFFSHGDGWDSWANRVRRVTLHFPLYSTQLQPPYKVYPRFSSNLYIMVSIVAQSLVDLVWKSGRRDALLCRHLAVASRMPNAATLDATNYNSGTAHKSLSRRTLGIC